MVGVCRGALVGDTTGAVTAVVTGAGFDVWRLGGGGGGAAFSGPLPAFLFTHFFKSLS